MENTREGGGEGRVRRERHTGDRAVGKASSEYPSMARQREERKKESQGKREQEGGRTSQDGGGGEGKEVSREKRKA